MWKWREVEHDNFGENNEIVAKKITISDCDRSVGFVDSMIKGKNNDYVTNNYFLWRIIKYCNGKSGLDMVNMKKWIINSNNCGSKHKCLQNFFKLHTSSWEYKCTCIHKGSNKHGFKGAWDTTSKLVKSSTSKLEIKCAHVSNAFYCYYHLSPLLTNESSSFLWDDMASNRWDNTLNKTTFTSNCTFVYLCIENRA